MHTSNGFISDQTKIHIFPIHVVIKAYFDVDEKLEGFKKIKAGFHYCGVDGRECCESG